MSNLSRYVSITLAVALAAAGGGCTKSARRNRELANADAYFKAGQFDKAEKEYLNAARIIQPPSTIALRQLGLLYSAEGRPLSAGWFLDQAAKAEPANAEVQVKLASVFESIGHPAEARSAALQALKLDPGNEEALVILCEISKTRQDVDQTEEYIDKMRRQDSKDRGSYHLALGTLAAKLNQIPTAEAEMNKALALNPKSSFTYIALGNLYRLPQTNHTLTKADLAKAGEAFNNAVLLSPIRSTARLIQADFLWQTGETNKAKQELADLTAKAPDYLPALYMQMQLTFHEGQWDDCSRFIRLILDRDPKNYDALMTRGKISMAKHNGEAAVNDFEQMDSQIPGNFEVQYELAVAHLIAGNKDLAVNALRKSISLRTNYPPSKLLLADLEIRRGDGAAASAMLTQLLKQPQLSASESADANLALARAYLSQQRPDQAVAIYQNLEKSYPKDPQLDWLEGRAFEQAQRLSDARKAFEKTLEINHNFLPALESLVDLDISANRPQDAVNRVNKEIAANTNSALLWLLQAKIARARHDVPQAEASLKKALQIDNNLPAAYLLLARLYVENTNYSKALENLNALASKTNDITALMEIGEIHDALKEYNPAREAYEKLLTINPSFGGALNNLAYLYSEYFHQPEKAYELAMKDRELSPSDPYVADTLGWILYKRKDYTRAVAMLEESADRQPTDAEVHYHLGMAHYMMGEEDPARLALQIAVSTKDEYIGKDEAERRLAVINIDPKTAGPAVRAELEKKVEKDPDDPIALLRLAAIQERDGDSEKAAATYEIAIKHNNQNVRAMARLAQLYANRLNQFQKGLDLAKAANKTSPDDPYVSETLGRLEFQAHDYRYALGLLSDATRILGDQPDLLHDLAWCYFSVGKTAEAQSAMQRALQVGTATFAKADDAKRFVAMTEACQNASRATAATAEIQKTLQADTNYAPAQMAAGIVQETQGHTREAEQLYEEVLAQYPLFVPADRRLAVLYAHDDEDAKAAPHIEKARAEYPGDPELSKIAGIVAYRGKDFQKSAQLLTLCSQINPNDAELFYYLGMDDVELKQPADAKKNLQRAIGLKLSDPLAAQAKRTIGELK